jgi:hypothetical protein
LQQAGDGRKPPNVVRTLLVPVVLSLALLACGDSKSNGASSAAPPGGLTEEQAARVVAKVGDTTITLGDYARALERMDPFDRLRYQTIEKRRELLDEMVDLQLLAAEAKRRGLGDDPLTQEAVRQLLRDALLDEVHKQLPPPAQITPAEIQAFYEANAAEFREPERRRVSAIVLDDAEKAKQVLEATAGGVNADAWGKLFFENSTTAKSEKKSNLPLDLAGDLGVVSAPGEKKGGNERVPPAMREAVFKIAKVGDVHPEVVSAGGKHYVVRMTGLTAAYERPVAEADRQIRVAILKQKMVEQEKQLEEELRKKYTVEIDESVLARVKQL